MRQSPPWLEETRGAEAQECGAGGLDPPSSISKWNGSQVERGSVWEGRWASQLKKHNGVSASGEFRSKDPKTLPGVHRLRGAKVMWWMGSGCQCEGRTSSCFHPAKCRSQSKGTMVYALLNQMGISGRSCLHLIGIVAGCKARTERTLSLGNNQKAI